MRINPSMVLSMNAETAAWWVSKAQVTQAFLALGVAIPLDPAERCLRIFAGPCVTVADMRRIAEEILRLDAEGRLEEVANGP